MKKIGDIVAEFQGGVPLAMLSILTLNELERY
jgi:hypothetical protein